MALCEEHRKEEYHDNEECVVCEKDRAIRCCRARNEQLKAQIEHFKKDYPFFDDVNSGNYTLDK